MAVAAHMQVPHGRSTASARVIPAFGNWDSYYNGGGDGDCGLPITQYFESAGAAGLRRGRQQQLYPSFRKDQHGYICCPDYHGHQLPPYLRSYHYEYCNQKRMMLMRNTDSHEELWWEKRRQSEEGPLMVRQPQQRRRGYHRNYEQQPAAAAARKQQAPMSGRTTPHFTPAAARPAGNRAPKTVDEDLYKIPPELLRLHQRATTRRVKR